jgi:tetratricopeptide (TPR) repeat protein
VHQVSPGESLATIADNYYGDPAQQEQIARDNGVASVEDLDTGSALVLRFDEREWQVAQKRAAAMKPYNRGVDFLEREQLDEAEREFRLALEIAPNFVNARYNLALVLMQRGQHEPAERQLAALVDERPSDSDFLFAYGHVLFLELRFAEAVAAFEQLLKLDPSHRRGAFGLARALQEAGRNEEAIAAWQAYLQLDSTSSWADTARRNLQQLQGG